MNYTQNKSKNYIFYQSTKWLLVMLLCLGCAHKEVYLGGNPLANIPLWSRPDDKRILQRVQLSVRGIELSLNAIADLSKSRFEGIAFLEAGAPFFHFIREGNHCRIIASPSFTPKAALCEGVYNDLVAFFSGFGHTPCPLCTKRLDSEQILIVDLQNRPQSLFRFSDQSARLLGLPQEVEITNQIYGYRMQVRLLEIRKRS